MCIVSSRPQLTEVHSGVCSQLDHVLKNKWRTRNADSWGYCSRKSVSQMRCTNQVLRTAQSKVVIRVHKVCPRTHRSQHRWVSGSAVYPNDALKRSAYERVIRTPPEQNVLWAVLSSNKLFDYTNDSGTGKRSARSCISLCIFSLRFVSV